MPWLPEGTSWAQVGVGFLVNLASTVFSAAVGFYWGKRRSRHRVHIDARRVDRMGGTKKKPTVIIATFTGYLRRNAPPMSDDEFRNALVDGDLTKLPIDATTPGIGQAVRLLHAYESSLEELILITTRSKIGPSSIDAASLLQSYVRDHFAGRIKITADEGDCIDLDQDDQLVNDGYKYTLAILHRLEKQKRYDRERTLVDVTGSVRGMQMGALLACLHPDQDVHVIGTKYKPNGDPDFAQSFPILIHFEPEIK